jgi:diaminopropionate ammonia-lyase
MEMTANPLALTRGGYPDRFKRYLSLRAAAEAGREITSWPGYAPTPLIDLVDLAVGSRVGRLAYKDEGGRFGLGSFKALGGAYAVTRIVRERPGGASGLTVCCATDGNHGRSVAWRAGQLGCRCVIYLHKDVSEGRERAIASFGAEIRRVDGNYDDSVRAAEADAQANGWTVVSDTSYPGYAKIPCDVMQGYSVMVEEILEAGFIPTHVFLQGGVGGLAAAVCAHLWETLGADAPRFIVVEPEAADCLYQSARAGRPVAVAGELNSLMAGLACGEVSEIAWEILSMGASHFVTISDAMAVDAMRLLASGGRAFPPIVAGESATAGLAAFLAIAEDEDLRREIGLTPESRVLCFGTEGDTDPFLYETLVGQPASEVRAEAVRRIS